MDSLHNTMLHTAANQAVELANNNETVQARLLVAYTMRGIEPSVAADLAPLIATYEQVMADTANRTYFERKKLGVKPVAGQIAAVRAHDSAFIKLCNQVGGAPLWAAAYEIKTLTA